MSGPAKDLIGEPNDAACAECHTIYSGPKAAEKVSRCKVEHELGRRREKARAWARGGPTQYRKSSEVSS